MKFDTRIYPTNEQLFPIPISRYMHVNVGPTETNSTVSIKMEAFTDHPGLEQIQTTDDFPVELTCAPISLRFTAMLASFVFMIIYAVTIGCTNGAPQ